MLQSRAKFGSAPTPKLYQFLIHIRLVFRLPAVTVIVKDCKQTNFVTIKWAPSHARDHAAILRFRADKHSKAGSEPLRIAAA